MVARGESVMFDQTMALDSVELLNISGGDMFILADDEKENLHRMVAEWSEMEDCENEA